MLIFPQAMNFFTAKQNLFEFWDWNLLLLLILAINWAYFLIKFMCLLNSLPLLIRFELSLSLTTFEVNFVVNNFSHVFELILFRCEFLQIYPINLFDFFSQRNLIQKLHQAPIKTVFYKDLFFKNRKIIFFFNSEHVKVKF